MITVGHHALRFVDGEGDEPEDEFEKTMVISSRGRVRVVPAAGLGRSGRRRSGSVAAGAAATAAKSEPAAAAAPRRWQHAGEPASQAKLQVLCGQFAGRELELVKTLTTLGRPGIQVAAITRRADGFYVVHVESGKENDFPLVNGAAIGQQARSLRDNDVLQLAGVKMGFFES